MTGRPQGRIKLGSVPAEPFLSWFVALRDRKRIEFQREFQSTLSGGLGFGGSARRLLSEADTIKKLFDADAFSVWCGIERREYNTLVNYHHRGAGSVSIDVVDRVLTAVGHPELMVIWYPDEFFDESGRWLGHPSRGGEC